MASSISSLIDGLQSLGSYGGVLNELEAVLDDPQSTVTDIASILQKDPDMASRLLRLGNSPFYGFPTRLDTVSDAIGLIGLQQVRDLIRVSKIIDFFDGISPSFFNMESFWKHSLACGVAARQIALSRRVPKAEKFFESGLLHDLGRLVILARAPLDAREIFDLHRSQRILLRDAETRVLGFDHSDIGYALLQAWSFPASLAEAVRHHHHPMASSMFQLDASLIHVADFLAKSMDIGSSGELVVPPLDMRAWMRLNLNPDMLESLMNTVDDQLGTVESVFIRGTKKNKR